MPKFVSGSSGQIYARDKLNKETDDEVLSLLNDDTKKLEKPSAINKKGSKEKQKNSLDLFKEELKQLHEDKNNSKKIVDELDQRHQTVKPKSVPQPLKPDPKCPTTLTLKVNLNPKQGDAYQSGSFNNGDSTSTNIYLGNLNPTVNENDLCDVFGKFGALASIKIMWPRTDEERARNRNSGFVAYMSRLDAERAFQAISGKEIRGYQIRLGWGKAVPLPLNPVYVPPELMKLSLPPPHSGLPFNAQLGQTDNARGYIVPNPCPKPLPNELLGDLDSNQDLKELHNAHEEFLRVFEKSSVKVTLPRDRSLLDRIHKTIEYVIKEGPVFEAIIIARENSNPLYSFLCDNRSPEHVYYRWKLYSILHGDDPYDWRTEEFRMFEGGPLWCPPPLNPYARGMPDDLIQESSKSLENTSIKKSSFVENSTSIFSEARTKGTLSKSENDLLGDMLRNLDPIKDKIGAAMMFCISHADAAKEVINHIHESLMLLETPLQKKIARIFLISDILHNCSAAVTNASYYREGFQSILTSIFMHLREYLISIEDRNKADLFKQKVLSVLGAWKEWTLYEDDFVIKLSNILLGIKLRQDLGANEQILMNDDRHAELSQAAVKTHNKNESDGEPLDDSELSVCLEAKGLSLRWYKSLNLSDDECEDNRSDPNISIDRSLCSGNDKPNKKVRTQEKIKFKSSKWETVDPEEVAEQVVTISKWESMAKDEEDASTDYSSSPNHSELNLSGVDNSLTDDKCDDNSSRNSQAKRPRSDKVEDTYSK